MKFFFLFLIVLTAVTAPLRVNAMEGFGDEIKKNQNKPNSSERLRDDTETTRDENQNEVARGTGIGVVADTASGDNSAELSNSRASLNPVIPINIESGYLTQQIELTQRACEKLKKQKDEIENSSLSPESRNIIESAGARNYAAWQEIRRSYTAFLEKAAAEKISESTRNHIFDLIAASNEASKVVQEILDLVSKEEGAYVSGSLKSSFVHHQTSTANLCADLSTHFDFSSAIKDDLQHLSHQAVQEKLISLLQPPPALDVRLLEDQEQQEMTHFFNNAAVRNPQITSLHSETADALLSEVQKAWDARALLKQIHAVKKETLERASEQLQKEEEALANKDLEKTILGRIAMITGKGAEGVANVPDPYSQIISVGLSGISTVADFFNKRREHAASKKAKKTFEKATQEDSASFRMAQEAQETAFEKDYQLQESEQLARKNEAAATRTLAESLKPPFLSMKENDWNSWGEKIATAAHLKRAWVSRITRKGKANPIWASHKAASAWLERMNQSKKEIEECEKEKVMTLEPLEKIYQETQDKAEEARETAYQAQESHDDRIQREIRAEEEYEAMGSLLHELEKISKKTTDIRMAIEGLKKETPVAFNAWKKAKKEREANEAVDQKLIAETEATALEAEQEAMKHFQKQSAVEKKYTRNLERAKAHLAADQAAWLAVWPEEVLYSKLQNQTAETTFANAEKEKSETAWIKAYEEACEMEKLWSIIAETNIQKASKVAEEFFMKSENAKGEKVFWENKAAIARGKIDFIKIKNLWNSCVEAAQNFIENPNFETDLKNTLPLAKAAEATAGAVEMSAALSVFPDVFKVTDVIKRAVRNLATAADMVKGASSPSKGINTTTWCELAQKEVKQSKKTIGENSNPTWKAEFTWVAEAVQDAADFVKSISEKYGSSKNSFYEAGQNEPSSPIKSSSAKNEYQKKTRKMRSVWSTRDACNKAQAVIEKIKESLSNAENTYRKKEKKWKGKKGFLDVRKKLALQWKKKNEQLSVAKKNSAQNILETSARLETAQKDASEADKPIDIFVDIPDQERKLAEERVVLDQEQAVLIQKKEEFAKQEKELTQDGVHLREQESKLAEGRKKFEEEKAAFEKSTQETQNREREALVKKEKELQALQQMLAEESEALAKKAEQLAQKEAVALEAKHQEEKRVIAQSEAEAIAAEAEAARIAQELAVAAKLKTEAEEVSNKAALQKAGDIQNEIKKITKQSREKSKLAHDETKQAPSWERVVALWHDIITLAEGANVAFDQLVTLHQEHSEHAPERFQKKWTKDLKGVKSEQALWAEQVSMWIGSKESAAVHLEQEKKETAKKEADETGKPDVAEKCHEAPVNAEATLYLGQSTKEPEVLNYDKLKNIFSQIEALQDAFTARAAICLENPHAEIASMREITDALASNALKAAWEAAAIDADVDSCFEKDTTALSATAAACRAMARVATTAFTNYGANVIDGAAETKRTAMIAQGTIWENEATLIANIASLMAGVSKTITERMFAEKSLSSLERLRLLHSKKKPKVLNYDKLKNIFSQTEALQNTFTERAAICLENPHAEIASMREIADALASNALKAAWEAAAIDADVDSCLGKDTTALSATAAACRAMARVATTAFTNYGANVIDGAAETKRTAMMAQGTLWENETTHVANIASLMADVSKSITERIFANKSLSSLERLRLLHSKKKPKVLNYDKLKNIFSQTEALQNTFTERAAICLENPHAEIASMREIADALASNALKAAWEAAAIDADVDSCLGKDTTALSATAAACRAMARVATTAFTNYGANVIDGAAETKRTAMMAQGTLWENEATHVANIASLMADVSKSITERVTLVVVAIPMSSIASYGSAQVYEFYAKAVVACAAGKRGEGDDWRNAGEALSSAEKNLAKAIKIEEAGKLDEAGQWREAAVLQQQSVEHYIKAAIAHAAGKANEGDYWSNAGHCFYWGAAKLEEAIKIEAAGKLDEARQWREAAVLQQQSVEPYIKAATAHAAGKTDEGAGWNNIGDGFYNAAEALEKAIEAEAAGKSGVAWQWREVANKYHQSSEKYQKAIQFRVDNPRLLGSIVLKNKVIALESDALALSNQAKAISSGLK